MPAALDTLVTALGWIGAIGAVTAYAMVTRGRWAPRSAQFQLTNLVSATFLCLVAGHRGVWPSVAANVVWIAVGVQALVVLVRARRRTLAAPRDLAPRDLAPRLPEGAQEVGLAA